MPRPSPSPRPTKAPYAHDSIFFTKEQLSVGTILTYFGRTAPQTEWTISRIISHRWSDRGNCLPEPVRAVRYLSDTVYLRCGREERAATFSYLSYSAIWRASGKRTHLHVVPTTPAPSP